MTAPVVPTLERNRLGIAALVLALIAIALPIVVFIVVTIAAGIEGSSGGPDAVGWNILGGFILAGVSVTAVAPIAIVALVLGIIAVTRKGKRKVQAIVAIILSVAPSLAIFGLPAAIDSMF